MTSAMISFAVDYAVFWSLLRCFKGIHYLFSACIGYFVGVCLNYILSIKWAFKRRMLKDNWQKEFGIFFLIEMSALVILVAIMSILSRWPQISVYFSKIMANSTVALWNYALKYRLLFKKKQLVADSGQRTADSALADSGQRTADSETEYRLDVSQFPLKPETYNPHSPLPHPLPHSEKDNRVEEG